MGYLWRMTALGSKGIGPWWKQLYQKASQNIVVLNLFWWLVAGLILLLNVQVNSDEAESLEVLRWTVFATLGYIMIPTVYFHNLVTLQRFFLRKRWFWGLAVFFGFNIVGALTLNYMAEFVEIFIGFVHSSESSPQDEAVFDSFSNAFGIYTFISLVGMMAQLARFSFLRQQKAKEAELNTLKGQLNPHFLFNSLNNLYGLSVTKSDKLPGLMLQLSDLLRYSLYDTQTDRVPLTKEVNYLRNYVELERIRLEDSVQIEFKVEGDPEGKDVAPLLLIPFIENAFKHHGTARNNCAKIDIQLKISEKELSLDCYNTVDPAGKRQAKEVAEGGLGTENTRKRLSLLYPSRHRLATEIKSDSYRVLLTLPLTA
ncbi:MAG TPA: hypothetical protein DCR93_25455 [Cytophagales bacterium]|nr:hypothetical protein [Cytophagales bacterium]